MVESGSFIEYCCASYVKVDAAVPVLLASVAVAMMVGFLVGYLVHSMLR